MKNAANFVKNCRATEEVGGGKMTISGPQTDSGPRTTA